MPKNDIMVDLEIWFGHRHYHYKNYKNNIMSLNNNLNNTIHYPKLS